MQIDMDVILSKAKDLMDVILSCNPERSEGAAKDLTDVILSPS
jgi:hypothetical protein